MVFLHLRLFIEIFLFWKQVGIRPFPTPWLRQHTISFPRVEVNDTLKPSHRWTNGPWPLKTIEANGWRTPKPSKNHWNQWSGGWKSFNGDGWVTPKPSKNHWKQWCGAENQLMVMVKQPKNHEQPLMLLLQKKDMLSLQKKISPSHRSWKMTIVHLYSGIEDHCCLWVSKSQFLGLMFRDLL